MPNAPGLGSVGYSVKVSTRGLPRGLTGVAMALLASHAGLMLYHYRVQKLPWLLLQLFDVDQENNLPTWFSCVLLLTAAIFLWLCAQQRKASGGGWSRHWQVLSVGFLLLSLDEVAGIHETINSIIEMSWAIPGGIVAFCIGAGFIPFLLNLPRRTATLFVLAGMLYLSGAVALEIPGNEMVGQRMRSTLEYSMLTLLEEGLEMTGVLLFLWALLDYMRATEDTDVNASLVIVD